MKSFQDYLAETIRTYGAVGHSPAMGNTMEEKDVAEGALKDIDIEYQDYKRMSPQQFKAAYKISKSEWLAKHHDLIKESAAYVMDEMRSRAGLSNKEIE